MAPAQQSFPLAAPVASERNGADRGVELAPLPASAAPAANPGIDAPAPPQRSASRPAAKKATAAKKAPARKSAGARKSAAKRPGGKRTASESEVLPLWVRRTTMAAVVAVAAVAAIVSYEHMRALADRSGEGWRAFLLPISVDGLTVAASMTMLVRRQAGQDPDRLARFSLALGLGASLAANVVAADPTLVDPEVVHWVVAAWPPVALGLGYELLMKQMRPGGGPGFHTRRRSRRRPGAVEPLDPSRQTASGRAG